MLHSQSSSFAISDPLDNHHRKAIQHHKAKLESSRLRPTTMSSPNRSMHTCQSPTDSASALMSSSRPCTPPRAPNSSSPTTPIYDRFTDPLSLPASALSSVNTTPTLSTPRTSQIARVPSTPSFVPYARASASSLSSTDGGPYGVRTPRTPRCARTYRYAGTGCSFANCSTFSVDSDYSTAGESFYGSDGFDDGDSEDDAGTGDGKGNYEENRACGGSGIDKDKGNKHKHASYTSTGTHTSSVPSTPSSAGPVTPLWPAFEVTEPRSHSNRSSTGSCTRHSCSHTHAPFISPTRPSPAPSLWGNIDKSFYPSIHSPSPVRSYRFLPADKVPAGDLRQQPSAASSQTSRAREPNRPAHPMPRAPAPFTTSSTGSVGYKSHIPSELSVFDAAPRQTLLADLEFITGKKLHFPILSRWAGERKEKKDAQVECKAGKEKARRFSKDRKEGRSSMEDEWLEDDAVLRKHQHGKAGDKVRVEVAGRGSCESWREKYAKREYWI